MSVAALTFDTFGTVVDWRGSVLAELQALGQEKRLFLEWERFLTDWRKLQSELERRKTKV